MRPAGQRMSLSIRRGLRPSARDIIEACLTGHAASLTIVQAGNWHLQGEGIEGNWGYNPVTWHPRDLAP